MFKGKIARKICVGGRKKVEVEDLNNRDKLTALMNEARRRGITYGELVAHLTPEETERIYDRYMGRRK